MRIFVAGATGAIGRPLLVLLREAGHDIIAMTRTPEKASALRQNGVRPVVADALDAGAVAGAVIDAKPEVVVNQLTDLPQTMDLGGVKDAYARNNRVRRDGTINLAAAARRAGVRRFISQSVAFWYAPDGAAIKSESDPLFEHAPDPIGDGVAALQEAERAVVQAPGVEGVVLRYGFFYGPGTWIARSGAMGEMAKKGHYPIVGPGEGVYSFIHVIDAARATIAFLDRGAPGIYNIVDDEPTPVREWLPVFAAAVGGPAPRRVPQFVAALTMGRGLTSWMSTVKGASNAKAKREIGWQLRYSTWRDGFVDGLG